MKNFWPYLFCVLVGFAAGSVYATVVGHILRAGT